METEITSVGKHFKAEGSGYSKETKEGTALHPLEMKKEAAGLAGLVQFPEADSERKASAQGVYLRGSQQQCL